MTTPIADETRIKQMLEEGKITEEEAGRLRDALDAQYARDEIIARQAALRRDPARRRLSLLLVFCGAFFLVGLIGGRFWLQETQGTAAESTEQITSNPSSTSPGRVIDLPALSQERGKTMGSARIFSFSIFVIVIVAVVGVAILFIYNGLIDARERVNSGWAQVENQYQRRLDLVPLLIDGVKTYMAHERETLTALTEARANALGVSRTLAGSPPQTEEQMRTFDASQGEVQSTLARLLAVVENYPDLKSSQNFLTLQDQIEGTENRIAIERRNYNEFSRRYNARTLKFPHNVIADLVGFEAKSYFQAQAAALEGLKDPFGREGE